MDDTPFINDGADTSLRKTVSLLNKIEAKTGSTTITGPVTVSNEVEVTNSAGSPIPVSGTVTANTGLTQPLTDAQLRATAVSVNESLIVNQGSLFLYSTTGTYGQFDCGADADYVVFNRAGGGGGFTQKLEFSATSDFATAYDTLSGTFAIFSEKFITNTGDLSSQEPTNTLLSSNESGAFVVNLRRLASYGGNENLKVRYVRLVVSGVGGGGFTGKFISFRSKTSDAFNMNAAPHRTLISGTVDINSAKRPLPVTDNDGSLTVDGTVTVNDMTSGNAKTKIVDSTGADVSYIPAGTAGTPSSSVLSIQGISGGTVIGIDSNHVGDGIQAYLNDHGNDIPVSNQSITNIDVDLGATTDSAATTDTGTFSAIALFKRGLQNWTSLLAKIPSLVSGRIPVDGSGVTQPVSGTFFQATQPTRETQPIGDYVINMGATASLSLTGSAVSTSGFDAGVGSDYVAVTLEGAGASGAFNIDLSTDNVNWVSGTNFGVYYDIQANSATDIYSHKTVQGTLFGSTRSVYNGRFLISNNQPTPSVAGNTFYRYVRLTSPASFGGWRYRFASYESPISSNGLSNPGGITRVNGRVDVGFVSSLPTLTATVTQATSSNLKGQAQILNSAGSLITYAESGTYGSPSVDVISVQNPQGTSAAIATFTSTTASTSLVSAATARKTLTVYNSGPGDLNISPTATCTTTNFQIRLASNDYWECPAQQTTMAHTAVFSSAGTAYVTTIS